MCNMFEEWVTLLYYWMLKWLIYSDHRFTTFRTKDVQASNKNKFLKCPLCLEFNLCCETLDIMEFFLK